MSDLFRHVSPVRLDIVRVLAPIVVLAGCMQHANGQALPTAEASPISTGFSLPTSAGELTYALSASQSVNWGFYSNSGHSSSTNISGDLGYISSSKRDPFSAILAGGHSFGISGQPAYNFVSLGLSQVLAVRKWNFVVADFASYLPQTPSAGFAGISGLGDLGVGLGAGLGIGLGSLGSLGMVPTSVVSQPAQGVLTNYANRIENSVSTSVQRDFTAKTGIHGSASYAISRFTDNSNVSIANQGLDSDSITASGGINHAYSLRNVVGGNFSYTNSTFTTRKNAVVTPDFTSEVASIYYFHQFNRRMVITASAGPEWTTVSLGVETKSLNTFANVSAAYAAEYWKWSLGYVRSTSSGYGVIGGALTNSVSLTAGRSLARVWATSLNIAYSENTSLPAPALPSYTFHTAVAGGQVSRALPHSFSMFASYTMQSQSNHGPLLTVLNAFSGHYQTLGVGLTYSPRAIHFGGH